MDKLRIESIRNRIAELPSGGITYKTINGKKYAYYQWTENGKQRSRRISDDEIPAMMEQISERKALQQELKKAGAGKGDTEPAFFAEIKLGDSLKSFVLPAAKLKKRTCYQMLSDYIYGNSIDKVLVLYGLRRTGKTTLIRQVIAGMPDEMLRKTAFIQLRPGIGLAEINSDLRILEKQGIRYLFLDEVTLMTDFIEGAALFSDIYAASGMKVVLSGTDSLGFAIAARDQLYDRCFTIHTTFIPYREFSEVLGIHSVDDYIRYGGTMSLGGVNYNTSASPFADRDTAGQYVDSAIAHNIQHSLKNYREGGRFRALLDLYENGELTNVINRVVEDINHRFTLEILTRTFRSADLSITAKNLIKDKSDPTDVLYRIDTAAVTNQLKEMLSILNQTESKIEITDAHRSEIAEYLKILELTDEIGIIGNDSISPYTYRTVVTQPGLRYSQAEALIHALTQDNVFAALSAQERSRITERILNEVKGRMLEDIILLETKLARPGCRVFKLEFAIGEFDMVIADPGKLTCEIFEIKHSKQFVPEQYRYLADTEKCKDTEFRFGTIVRKCVIYRGESTQMNGIEYKNAEEYLCSLR